MNRISYTRVVRLNDTDAAGVVYFASALNICHECYEEVLITLGINLSQLFTRSSYIIPIVHARVDFIRQMLCGDCLVIYPSPKFLSPDGTTVHGFEIDYEITRESDIVARATTRHLCVDRVTRKRVTLPQELENWCRGNE